MKKLILFTAIFCTIKCTAQTIDATIKKYVDSTVAAQIKLTTNLMDSVKVLVGQATIINTKNPNGSNTGTIDLTLIWNEINALKAKIAAGFTITGVAK